MSHQLKLHPLTKNILPMLNFYEYQDRDAPLPPGPWNTAIREALHNFYLFGPQPDPWKNLAEKYPAIWDLIGNPLSLLGLNPQPFPPKARIAFIVAKELTNRIQSTYEISVIMGNHKVAKYWLKWLQTVTNDICPDSKKLTIPKWWPAPPSPSAYKVDDFSLELLVIGCYFQYTSNHIQHEEIKSQMHSTGDKLIHVVLNSTIGFVSLFTMFLQ